MDHHKHLQIIHGKHMLHDGKHHQLYHHEQHGFGILDSVGNFIKKAYTEVISPLHSAHQHLKEHKYAKKILEEPIVNYALNYIPAGNYIRSGLQTASDLGYGKKRVGGTKPLKVPMQTGMGKKKIKK